jgi:hypothetical protein
MPLFFPLLLCRHAGLRQCDVVIGVIQPNLGDSYDSPG